MIQDEVGLPSWRIAVISTVAPITNALVEVLRGHGHEPVAVVAARSRRRGVVGSREFVLSDENGPEGIDILMPGDKASIGPLLRAYEPDLALCWGYPWKIAPDALEVPRLGAVNMHPGLLPRHRGPVPMAWVFREGDPHFGVTWHRMDAELDTGPILAQDTVPIGDDDCAIEDVAPRLLGTALGLLPRVFERVAAGDPGDPQPEEGASWAGHFGEDYLEVDWSQSARAIHNQVRAWTFTFGVSGLLGPIAELEGERVRLVRTSLTEKPGATRVECGDGPLWIVATEPA
jgi:methionyl-tRNA formyltransferase